MTQPPRISVIIPTWNEEGRIAGLLAELQSQNFDEIIVADGGSGDRTQELVAGFPGVRLLMAPRGRAAQMNAGAAVSSGGILLFLHADCRLPDGAAQAVREAMADARNAGGAFHIRTVDDGHARSWASRFLFLADLRSRYTRYPYGDQAIFVRRNVFRAMQGFPPVPLMEDLAFSRRLWKYGRVVRLKQCVTVSGRRFLHRPIAYTAAVNVFPLLYRLGVPPARLAKLYGNPR
jgi:rSAM/selenodomain-associated transferase 2